MDNVVAGAVVAVIIAVIVVFVGSRRKRHDKEADD